MKEVLGKSGKPIIKAFVCEPGVIKLFFDEKKISELSLSGVENRCYSMIMAGDIKYFDVENIDCGEIDFHYNPIYQEIEHIEPHIDKLISYIENSAEH